MILLGDWVRPNLVNIVRILYFFFLVSSLKVNLNKLNFYVVCMNWGEVEYFSLVVGCRPDKFPFNYLGLLVGKKYNKDCWLEIDIR